jgi:hypothetical protein
VILNHVSKITAETANLQKRASISGTRGGHAKGEQDNGRRSVINKTEERSGEAGTLKPVRTRPGEPDTLTKLRQTSGGVANSRKTTQGSSSGGGLTKAADDYARNGDSIRPTGGSVWGRSTPCKSCTSKKRNTYDKHQRVGYNRRCCQMCEGAWMKTRASEQRRRISSKGIRMDTAEVSGSGVVHS